MLIVHPSPDKVWLPVFPLTITRRVHTAHMAVTFAVLGDTEPEALAALQRMCDLLSLEPVGPPHQIIGRDRWMGRAYSPGSPAGGQHPS